MTSGWTSPVPLLMTQTTVCLTPPVNTGARGKVITIYLADEFSTDTFSASLNGLIFYVDPSSARGRLPDENDGDPFPKVLIYTMTDGVYICTNVSHVSDMTVMCVHTLSTRMRTGSSALVVIDVDNQQSARDSVTEYCCQLNYQVDILFPVVPCCRYTSYHHAYEYILLSHGHTSNPCTSHGNSDYPTVSSG